jgi:hypothetical protein
MHYKYTVTIWLLIIFINLGILLILKIVIMLKTISNLGKPLNKLEQKSINGGGGCADGECVNTSGGCTNPEISLDYDCA